MKKIFTSLFFFFIFANTLFAQPNDVLVHADQMPYFSGCSDFKNGTDEKRNCSNEALVAFLANQVQYPTSAKSEGIEGTVYVSFIIDENGKVTSPSVLRDIGAGCGEAALNVVRNMPDWEPGVHEGNNAKIKLNLPVQFSLKNTNPIPTDSDDYKITWGTLKGNQVSPNDLKANMENEIIVRDQFGESVIYDELVIAYKRGDAVQSLTSNGIMDKKQKKLIKKVKPDGLVYVGVIIRVENKKIQVGREFNILK